MNRSLADELLDLVDGVSSYIFNTAWFTARAFFVIPVVILLGLLAILPLALIWGLALNIAKWVAEWLVNFFNLL